MVAALNAGSITLPRRTERSAHTVQGQHWERGPNISQPKGWGVLQSWLQRRQSVPGCVTWARKKSKSPSVHGLSVGLRGRTCCRCALVSGFIQHGLLPSYSCTSLPDHLHGTSDILARRRYILWMWGEWEPAHCLVLVLPKGTGEKLYPCLSSASTAALLPAGLCLAIAGQQDARWPHGKQG